MKTQYGTCWIMGFIGVMAGIFACLVKIPMLSFASMLLNCYVKASLM